MERTGRRRYVTSTRRRFLRASGTGLVVALAGCSALDDPTGDDPDDPDRSGADSDGTDAAPSPEAAARTFVDRLFDGAYRAAYEQFSGAARTQTSPARVERVRLGLEAAAGEFRSIDGVETGTVSGLDRVDLSLSLSERAAPLRVLVDADAALRGVTIPGEHRRASYVEEAAFTATEHALDVEDCALGATLTTPVDADRTPGVVIVHGSGPTDRDGTLAANEPYRDLAEGLASRGVSVLRYDKRTHACEVPVAERTVDRVTVDDALAAVAWLRERDAVDPADVTVVGHSLGAAMAPEIAARDGDLAGIVGLATPARPLDELILDQLEYLANVGERRVDAIARRREEWEAVAERLDSGEYDRDELLLGLPGALWESLEGYDQVEVARTLSVPRTYLQGGRDYQVTTEADFALWQSALGDDDAVTLAAYPELDHLFLRTYGPSVPAAYGVAREVAEPVVAAVADRVRA